MTTAAGDPGRVTSTPGVCGGEACIRGTRIMVWLLVYFRRRGRSDADLLADYPGLMPEDLAAAWQYEATHREEIERAIKDHEEA